MDIYAFGPIAAVLDAAYAVLHNLTLFLTPFATANAAALAVIVLTLALRLLLIPVGVSQARAQQLRQRLAPRLTELRRLHGTNPERLQRETAALYAAENASPLAGCLPLLVQAPILSIVYGLFVLGTINGHDNALLAGGLFGSPLGTSILTGWGAGPTPTVLLVGGVLLGVLLVAQLLSRRLMLAQGAVSAAAPAPGAASPAAPGALSPAAQATMTGVLSWLPLISVVFAAFVPLAAAIYLTVSALWGVTERALLWRMLRPAR
ncbi:MULTISPECIES: membrane protein insertase YidC [unclassified Cryobacterium]|uniref:YidC/Oxa1 family membrane protein insertase n=1 Tax=unclassified Cryobacterium TaxID=2649013 RepID=UPI001068E478|nr:MULTISPECIES: membrane protein insertase YidC [unclassified Cryobacterium]TFC58009.1 membrane protein insertase YidC [Cryobacterium sp. TMB3-1-2]TFC67857.1 membrane protein insertase YidC [Cryobacterium sp. TMB3-15]TFC76776.1 membrane protein insertase YidC [Cryobacterium sp. TMB3-10]TFD39996.1 membrane protein insertase YidC [Cryobacterium sp. TMB3-12]